MRINKNIIYALLAGGILVGIVSTVLLLRSSTETNSNASTPTTSFTVPTPSGGTFVASNVSPTQSTSIQSGSTCTQPATVQNVKVSFPGCDSSDQCSYTQASCSWDAVSGASSYTMKITQVESGQVVKDQSIPAGTTSVLFDIQQEKTYKCEVSAVADCGSVGVAGTDQLLCTLNGLVPTVSPTAVPTAVPTAPPSSPSATLIPPTATPTIALKSPPPVSGPRDTLLAATAVGSLLMVLGGLLFLI